VKYCMDCGLPLKKIHTQHARYLGDTTKYKCTNCDHVWYEVYDEIEQQTTFYRGDKADEEG